MDDVMTAQRIREIRLKYGMSQKAFAHVLGIGSATMARYEAGDPPTKAMANLIRAAENPEFMRDCLERDGSGLSSKQQERSKQLVYGLCTIKEEEGEMKLDINQIYEITLRQEVLNEKAAEIAASLFHLTKEAEDAGDVMAAAMLDDLSHQVWLLKSTIIYKENRTLAALDHIDKQLDIFKRVSQHLHSKAA